MPEQTPRTLNYYTLAAFKDAYWDMRPDARVEFHVGWLAALRNAAQKVDMFQSAKSDVDLIIWSAARAEEPQATADFFECFARACSPCAEETLALWK